ncbi:hypothetical protein POM88_040660 [Heracleum sosnowskyi]|uniref:Transposase MuDR plant domain-containing protein n=1 Tax=Heracleum sosnowskyi TaxID=360622 RepID=A0AAD8HEW4_9APIA|nr:hypothetical protein POM88_040660 [Heracleum sosnowskyi]
MKELITRANAKRNDQGGSCFYNIPPHDDDDDDDEDGEDGGGEASGNAGNAGGSNSENTGIQSQNEGNEETPSQEKKDAGATDEEESRILEALEASILRCAIDCIYAEKDAVTKDVFSSEDEEWCEIRKNRKLVKQVKKKSTELTSNGEDKRDFENDYESDSFNVVELESTYSSDLEVESAQTKKPKKVTRSIKMHTTFNPKTPMKNINFEPGLLFTSVQVLKNAIIDYAVEQKREIWYSKNDLQRVQARCRDNCPWYLFASRVDTDGAFQVKTYNINHNCVMVNKHKFVRSDCMNDNPEDKVDSCYSKNVYMQDYQQLLRPMKGSVHWPKTGLPDILPPKARRMLGRPKKHRRKEQGEEGA